MQDAELELLGSIAAQMLSGDSHIEAHGKSVPVKRASGQHLKTATFTIDGRVYTAI